MDDSRAWFKKLLFRKLKEEQEERYRKQIPFREIDERYLERLKEKGYKGIPPNQRNKNFMVMELLSHVPDFKKDIVELRKELGIKDGGLESWWEMEEWAREKDITDYEADFNRGDDDVRGSFPSNTLEKKAFEIGVKYRLPFNFYGFPYRGLPIFILTGRIVPPDTNYDIGFHFEGEKLLWTELIAYAPLTKEELQKGAASLRETQLGLLPQFFKDSDAFARRRYRDKAYTDLLMLDEQVRRSGKPKKVKKYKGGSYLALLSKGKKRLDGKMKRLECLHKVDIQIVFDNPTSDEIGKKQGVSGEVARQAKKRLNSLAKELFGHGLES